MTTKSHQFKVAKIEGKSPEYAVARSELDPEVRHAVVAANASADLFSGATSTVTDLSAAMQDMAGEAAGQDMSSVGRMLTAQALSLDAIFTQMARKAHANLSEYPDAAERYMRLAFKAQTQSRATLEALVKLHQPREQTVRHIHVGPNGQAVFVENLSGGLPYAYSADRPLGPSASGPALLGTQPSGTPLPMPCGERQEAVPAPRRRGRVRRTAGQS